MAGGGQIQQPQPEKGMMTSGSLPSRMVWVRPASKALRPPDGGSAGRA